MTAKNIRLHEEKSDERGGGERHYGLPRHKERKSLSKQRTTGSASSIDMKEGRTRREEGHEGRKDTKGGRTQREGGHCVVGDVVRFEEACHE